jgi:lipopolysaccharide transport system ATP-binding protein
MSTSAIVVENLSKRYIIGRKRDPSNGLRHAVEDALRRPLQLMRGNGAKREPDPSEFWALSDVSFSVREGAVVGILGRNGAGRSTLLKILSRITQPTAGRVKLYGRVASLLEVGTGFHPELTGRENIFLNGAILGMSNAEIKSKFDAIVEFAEIEKFLDTPVKRYSSGMYVRLAFAVAAHLEPEILIVDEVLAVGDAGFQQKCLGKMENVARGGRTVLFVSHNIGALRQLCTDAVVLDKGRLDFTGTLGDAVERYLSMGSVACGSFRSGKPIAPGRRGAIHTIDVLNTRGDPSGAHTSTEAITLSFEVECAARIPACQLAVRITNFEGVAIFTTTNVDTSDGLLALEPGFHRLRFDIPANFLACGRYSITAALCIPGVELIDEHANMVVFDVHDGVNHATKFHDLRRGVVTPLLKWEHHHDTRK